MASLNSLPALSKRVAFSLYPLYPLYIIANQAPTMGAADLDPAGYAVAYNPPGHSAYEK